MDTTTAANGHHSRSSLHDARQLETSTSSAAALAAVESALESMLSYFGDPLAALDEACAHDPAWAQPHTLRAALLLTLAERGPTLQAREALATAEPLLRHATERERAHWHAAHSAASGDWDRACGQWEALLVRWPRDIAALLFAHLFDFYRGDALNLRRRPQRVLPHWSADLPGHGYVLGMLAFGLEESGQYPEAEDTGHAALAENARDPWAVHAVVHVHEMQGRHQQGARWLRGRAPDWAVDNGFAFHNWFHAALFALEALDLEDATATFDDHLAPATEMALQRVDGTAVLWRLRLLGADVRSRFQALHERWEAEAGAGFYAFNDLHMVLAAIGADDPAGLREMQARLRSGLDSDAAAGATNRRMAAEVGQPLLQAMDAYAEGRWSEAAQDLLQVRDRAHRFGGSHAQRDLLTLTLLDAAARAGDTALALHVLHERYPAKRDTALTAHWRERIGAATA